MGFFRRNADEEEPDGQSESLARIAQGGIPASAQARLQALSGDGSMFTSGLSIKEFAVLDRVGPRPLSQVMGASVIRTGWQYLPALPPGEKFTAWAGAQPGGLAGGQQGVPRAYGSTLQNPFTEPSLGQVRAYQWHTDVVCELNVLTEAWNMARRRALDRLREEALQVRADAVVGVHVRRGDHDLGSGTIEYVVNGTAIRLPGSSGRARPALSDLSVQDYWRLLRAGHEPVGLLATTVVVFASPPRSTRAQRARTLAQNQELDELSGAFCLARETVRAALRGQVADVHGGGVVGVEFSHSVHRDKLALASSLQTRDRRGWHLGRFGIPYFVSGHSDIERRGWVITIHAAGTAVRPTQGPSEEKVKTTVRMEER